MPECGSTDAEALSANGSELTGACVARWRSGDESAFASLHRRFAPLLRSRVLRGRVWPLIAKWMQAEDVVQEIWTRAVPAARREFESEGPGSFLAFLGRIADRTMIDLARTLHAQKRADGVSAKFLDTAAERAAGPRPGRAVEPTPTGCARHSELMEVVHAELLPREIEAWELVEMQRYTTDEAGLAMRCSGSAVRGLLLRGRAKLIRRIGQIGNR